MKQLMVGCAIVSMLCIPACGEDEAQLSSSRLQVVYPGASAWTVHLDGSRWVSLAHDVRATGELALPAGHHNLRIASEASATALELEILAEPGVAYTLVGSGPNAAAAILLTNGRIQTPLDETGTGGDADDDLSVRFVHTSATAGPLDIFVTGVGDELASADPAVIELDNGDASDYVAVADGAQRLRITEAAEVGPTLYDSGSVELTATGEQTLIVMDDVDRPGALTLLWLTEDGATPVAAFSPCAGEDADNTPETATAMVAGVALGAICEPGDVDYFRFDLEEAALASVTLKADAVDSPLVPGLSLGAGNDAPMDSVQGPAGERVEQAILLMPGTYYVAVTDAGGAGSEAHDYELHLELSSVSPTMEATGGTFVGSSNLDSVDDFAGNFIALSVREADDAPVAYKVMASVTPAAGVTTSFLYDPAYVLDGVLRVMLVQDGELVALQASPLQNAAPRTDVFAPQRTGLLAARSPWLGLATQLPVRALNAVSGTMRVELPGRSFEVQVVADDALTAPAVESMQWNTDRDTVRVTFEAPERSTVFDAEVFGRQTAVSARAQSTRSPIRVAFDESVPEDESVLVRLRAGDNGRLALPLPEGPLNLSETLYQPTGE